MTHPRSAGALPPQGGATGGPAKPDPRWPLGSTAQCFALAALLACTAATAQSVAMTGGMGSRALLVIDGKTVTASAGSTVHGVKVISVASDHVVVEMRGERQTVRLGAAQVDLGSAGGPGGGSQIVLTADSGGHFQTQGTINGRTVTFMVDTGATTVSMSAADATRIGLKYEQGQPIQLQTANGVIRGWRLKLHSVRVGDVEIFDVDGVVAQRDMPVVLLGNSFLSRFQMKRENDRMTLERRF